MGDPVLDYNRLVDSDCRFTSSWDEEAPPEDANLALRAEQLEFRRWEIYLAYHAFRSLTGEGEHQSLLRVDGTSIFGGIWKGVARCDKDVALVGHSFGGATVVSSRLSRLASTNSSQNYFCVRVL